MRPPLIVVEGPDQAFARARAEVVGAGWETIDGCAAPRRDRVCLCRVEDEASARSVVMAALAGGGVLAHGVAPREVLDRLCDDLRRLGPLDHRLGDPAPGPALDADERALLELLLGGSTLGWTARQLHLSRRTADRRLAHARELLGARTTAEALVLARRAGITPRQ